MLPLLLLPVAVAAASCCYASEVLPEQNQPPAGQNPEAPIGKRRKPPVVGVVGCVVSEFSDSFLTHDGPPETCSAFPSIPPMQVSTLLRDQVLHSLLSGRLCEITVSPTPDLSIHVGVSEKRGP